jgi:hypothetical protein
MAQVPNLMGLTAYHGTPHTIKGKFDISKVGTGEGAQAYGHGMYFAENPAVAKEYQKKLGSYFTEIDGKQIDLTNPRDIASSIVANPNNQGLTNAQIASAIRYNPKGLVPLGMESKVEEIATQIEKGNLPTVTTNKGNLYKVDIPDADIPKMVNFDKPLQDQPKDIQEWFATINPEEAKKGFTGAALRNYITSPDTSKLAAEQLLALGYKGIRYLDEGSRSKPYAVAISTKKGPYAESEFATKEQAEQYIKEKQAEGFKTELKDIGTSNFVVFEPSNVKILEQNSKPMTRKEILEQELKKVVE